MSYLPVIFALTAVVSGCVPSPAAIPADATGAATPHSLSADKSPSAGSGQVIALPTPRLKAALSLEEALSARRSVRSFGDQRLTAAELGQLLWAAQGITSPSGQRTAPSAGALYPLEVYAVTPDGAYRYAAQGHRLVPQVAGDVRKALAVAAVGQASVSDAPSVIVIAAVYARTAGRYGAERSPRYVHLEAGHATQNVLLQAVALGLGAAPIGAFDDERVKAVLALPPDQQPLYLIPVGHPN
jgi:SagB-type dehydrogenase family enzyme